MPNESNSFDRAAFDLFVAGLHLRYLSSAELLAKTDRIHPSGARNSPPPPDLWPNIGATARVLDEFRARWGAPVIVHSTYRSPGYNRAVGGEPRSQHLRYCAIDFSSTRGAPRDWGRALQALRASGLFKGGIGIYPAQGFVHVDTRGKNADWGKPSTTLGA